MVGPTPSLEYARKVLAAFSRIPYENLSKINQYSETDPRAEAFRYPEIILDEFFRCGAGGTCFSLTWFLYRYLRHCGLEVCLVMGDRHYGENTHSAVLCILDGRPCLLDVGFLVFEPLPLWNRNQRILVSTPMNEIEVEPGRNDSFEVATWFRGQKKHRFTVKTSPVSEPDFKKHWAKTFQFEMMNYPLVTRLENGTQYYLQGTNWQVRTKEKTERKEIPVPEIPGLVENYFGIDPALTRRALELTLSADYG